MDVSHPSANRLDPGVAIVLGAAALFLLSCLLPWYGRSLTTTGSAAVLSVSGRVSDGGTGWLLVIALFAVTALVTFGRSRISVLISVLCGVLLAVAVVELVRRIPTIPVPADLRPATPLVQRGATPLIGAALAVLAGGLAVVGVVVHAVACARGWRRGSAGSDIPG